MYVTVMGSLAEMILKMMSLFIRHLSFAIIQRNIFAALVTMKSLNLMLWKVRKD